MSKPTNPLGLSKEDAAKMLDKLLPKFIDTSQAMAAVLQKTGDPNSAEYIQLKASFEELKASTDWARDWYQLRVLESVEEESSRLQRLNRRLQYLTLALVVLTGVLILRTFV